MAQLDRIGSACPARRYISNLKRAIAYWTVAFAHRKRRSSAHPARQRRTPPAYRLDHLRQPTKVQKRHCGRKTALPDFIRLADNSGRQFPQTPSRPLIGKFRLRRGPTRRPRPIARNAETVRATASAKHHSIGPAVRSSLIPEYPYSDHHRA